MQAVAWLEHIDIVQSRSPSLPVGSNVPVKTLEPPDILELITARHEHDVVRGIVQLQDGQTCLEKADTVILALLELVEGTAERTLFIVEQVGVPRRVVIPIESNLYPVRFERFKWPVVLEKSERAKQNILQASLWPAMTAKRQ